MIATTTGSTDATDIDDEQTKLLTFQLCLVFAVARRDALALLREGLAQVIEGSEPAAALGDIGVVSELLVSRANYEAALSTLASPVQRSLREFVSR